MRGIRNRAVRKMMAKLKEMGAIDHLTGIIAGAEHEVLTAAKRLEDATDQDVIGEVPAIEMRRESLEAMIDAMAGGSFDDLWLENVAPELLDTTDGVEGYLGMDGDEWKSQIGRWAETYRNSGAEGSDRALAEHHVRNKWGVDLATFEERVVEFDGGEAAERLFAGNFRAACTVMHNAADELEET